MSRGPFMASWWAKLVVLAWMIVFPVVFIALPLLEMYTSDAPESWTPVWALIVWMLGPWAASVWMKYARPENDETEQES